MDQTIVNELIDEGIDRVKAEEAVKKVLDMTPDEVVYEYQRLASKMTKEQFKKYQEEKEQKTTYLGLLSLFICYYVFDREDLKPFVTDLLAQQPTAFDYIIQNENLGPEAIKVLKEKIKRSRRYKRLFLCCLNKAGVNTKLIAG